MRPTLSLFVLVSFLPFAAAVVAEPGADAKAILDQAIRAAGGQEKLARRPATTFKSQGTILFNGATKLGFSDEWAVQAPDKFRWDLRLKTEEREVPVALLFTDQGGWLIGEDGKARQVPADYALMFRLDLRAVLAAHWLPLLQEKGVELTPLGELKIDGRLAVGVKATRKGRPDLDLFFDKETRLPVRLATRFRETKDGPEVQHTFHFRDYKEADGVKYFSKLTLHRDDTLTVEMEVTELKRLDKIDDGTFTKP